MTPGVDFVICSTDGEQILSISGGDYIDIIGESEFSSNVVTKTVKNYVISTERGVGVDWNYMCVSDSERYMRVFRITKLILVCCFSVVIFLSLLIGYYFTRKNNQIIFKLSSILKTDKNTKDEYATIYQSVNEIIADANQKSAIIYRQQKNQINSLMKDLLAKGALPEKTDRNLKQAGVDFEHRYFCVAEVEAVKYSKIFFEENDDLSEAQQFANYIIANVYSDLFNAALKCYPAETGNRVALIINCAEQFVRDKKELNKILEFGAAFIEENFNFELKITISAIVEGKENIHKCYESILWSKDYRTVKNDIIFSVDEFEKGDGSQQGYYYPVKDEQLLAADIKRGAYEKVEEEINRIFDINIKKNTAPKFMKILASNIIGLIKRVINPQETRFSGAISEPEAAEKQLLFIVSVQKRETPGALSPFSV